MAEKQLQVVTIYTDGACLGNPGPGGYAAILLYNRHRKEISGGYARTTNNRMELMAVIAGLRTLKRKVKARVYCDSKYVVDAMKKRWPYRWRTNGWRRGKEGPARNPDLWQELLDLCEQHQVEFLWVRGHSGVKENERADQLSVQAAQSPNLPADPGFRRGAVGL